MDVMLRHIRLAIQPTFSGLRRCANVSLLHNMFHVKLKVYFVVPKIQASFALNSSVLYIIDFHFFNLQTRGVEVSVDRHTYSLLIKKAYS